MENEARNSLTSTPVIDENFLSTNFVSRWRGEEASIDLVKAI